MKKILILASALVVPALGSAAEPAGAAASAPAAPAPSASMVGATMKEHVLVNSKELKWVDGPPSMPAGVKMAVLEGDPKTPDALFTIRAKLPNNWKIQPHFHPADEHITVISGTFYMGMGDKFDEKAGTALTAGGFGVMPKDHHHFAWAKGETVIQLHGRGPWGITYVNPADDPRNAKTN